MKGRNGEEEEQKEVDNIKVMEKGGWTEEAGGDGETGEVKRLRDDEVMEGQLEEEEVCSFYWQTVECCGSADLPLLHTSCECGQDTVADSLVKRAEFDIHLFSALKKKDSDQL